MTFASPGMARGVVATARAWWTFIVRGIIAIIFGIVAFFAPVVGAAFLVGLFAAWAIIDGITALIGGWQRRERDGDWWLNLIEGIAGLAAGVLALIFPVLAAGVLVILIAAWAVVTGIFEIIAAIGLRKQIDNEIWLGLAGLASIIFGVIAFLFPGAGVLAIVWVMAAYAIIFGIFMLVLGWRLRGVNERIEQQQG